MVLVPISFLGFGDHSLPSEEEKDFAQNVLFAITAFLWAAYLWETFLSSRQRRIYLKVQKMPPNLQDIMEEEEFEKARVYSLDRANFSLVKELFDQLVLTLVLFGGLPLAWDIGRSMTDCFYTKTGWKWEKGSQGDEIWQSLACVLVINTFNKVISLPFSIYSTFVVEAKHGFNKQTPWFYVKDQIKAFLVGQIITFPLIGGFIAIIQVGGDYFFIFLWLFSVVVMLFLMAIYPDFIAPLFDKYTPLEEGPLRTSIEELAASLHFPLKKIYIVEGSKRSAHSNAYFYGFWNNKRIVLFDTLLKDKSKSEEEKEEGDQKDEDERNKKEDEGEGKKEDNEVEEKKEGKGCSNEEILAVLGHELGHWYHNHVLKNIVIIQANLFLMFLFFSMIYHQPFIYHAFGFMNERPILMGLIIVLQILLLPYQEVLGFLVTALSRHFEFQADRFAKSLRKAGELQSALVKLNRDNLGFPIHDWLYSAWHHSHPPLLQRLEGLQKGD